MNLFIDTNRYLAFYGLPLKELKELETLIELIQDKKITLWLPEQVKNEFYRNREERLLGYYKKIESLVKEFKDDSKEFPNIPECEEYRGNVDEAQKTIKKEKNKIKLILEEARKQFEDKIKKFSFFADVIVKGFFSSATMIPSNKEIASKAVTRHDSGNPPGKEDSYGDSIIWESLLGKIPEGEDLYFVGSDNHFKSKLDKNDFSPYLKKEWEEKKKSNISIYEHLGAYIKDKIPKIKTSDNIIEEETKIADENFITLAEAISNLSSQSNAIAEAISNLSSFRSTTIAEAISNLSSFRSATIAEAISNLSSQSNAIARLAKKR